jgi:hypothetical protein
MAKMFTLCLLFGGIVAMGFSATLKAGCSQYNGALPKVCPTGATTGTQVTYSKCSSSQKTGLGDHADITCPDGTHCYCDAVTQNVACP